MLSDSATQLLRELQGVSWIPTYNDSLVRSVEKEITELYEWVQTTLEGLPEDQQGEGGRSDEDNLQLLTLHFSLEHNKRAVLGYLKYRLEHVLQLRWEMGTAVVPPELADRLSQPELDAAREYDHLLQKYMDDVGEDLCKGMQPPKSVRIAVKVKEDFGELVTDSGVMNLQRNTTLFMRRDEVEPLIRQGVLEHVQASA